MFNLKFTSSGCALGKILLPLCPSLCMYKVRLMGNSSDSSQLRVDSFFHVFLLFVKKMGVVSDSYKLYKEFQTFPPNLQTSNFQILAVFHHFEKIAVVKLPILDGVRVLRPSLVSSIGISSGQAQMPCRQPMDVKLNCRCFHNYSFGVSYHITSQAFFTSNHITASSVNFLCLPF